jgi:uncharacterized protein YjbI with pentapeptide repeats
MNIEIRSMTGKVLISGEYKSLKDAVEKNKLDLQWADLQRVNLRDTDLQWSDLRRVNLRDTDLHGANLDFSAWPLRCGSLSAKIDDRVIRQLLYHAAMPAQNNDIVIDPKIRDLFNSELFKKVVNEFHRMQECGEFKGVK